MWKVKFMATKKLWVLVLLFACLSMILSSMEIKEAKAVIPITVTKTFSSLSYDGMLYYEDENYATAYNSDVAEGIKNTTTSEGIGQFPKPVGPGLYNIYRTFLFFDTNIIPDDATLLNATLSLYVTNNYSDTDFNVTLQHGWYIQNPNQPPNMLNPHIPLIAEDYSRTNYYSFSSHSSKNTSTITGLGYWNIPITGIDVINILTEGITKLCLRSNREINGIVPTGNEYIKIYFCEQGVAYAPKLYVTYETEGYRYVVHGPYYENGAVAPTIANVTLYSKTENPYSFILNGTSGMADNVTLDVEQAGWYFQWNATAGHTRSYYLSSVSFDEFWVYVCNPTKTYATYTIAFLDLAGVLKSMPYVSVERYINGSKIIEKQKTDVEKKVTFYLEAYTAYTLVLGDTSTTYTFGDVIFADSLSIALTIKAVDFPKATLFTYKYVRVYGERVLGTPYGNITITYQDILNMTNSVVVAINYKNGTNVYNTTLTTNSFVHTWSSALNNTDYAVVLTINHQQYGVYLWKQYFPRGMSAMPWGMDWFGHLPFNTAYLLPALIIIFAGACFSVVNAPMGAFVMVIMAIILSYLGWLPIPASILVTAFTFTIIMALIYAKRKIQT